MTRRCGFPDIDNENCQRCNNILAKYCPLQNCSICKENSSDFHCREKIRKLGHAYSSYDFSHAYRSYDSSQRSHRCDRLVESGVFCPNHANIPTCYNKKPGLTFEDKLILIYCPNDELLDRYYYHILGDFPLRGEFFYIPSKDGDIYFSNSKLIVAKKTRNKETKFPLNLFLNLSFDLQLTILKKIPVLEIFLLYVIVHPLRVIIQKSVRNPKKITTNGLLTLLYAESKEVNTYFNTERPLFLDLFNRPIWYDNPPKRQKDKDKQKQHIVFCKKMHSIKWWW